VLTESACRKLLQQALGRCRGLAAEALLDQSREALTRFANNRVTQNVETTGAALVLRVFAGKRGGWRLGRASTSDLSPAGLQRVAERAREAAAVGRPDPELLPLLGPQRYREPPPGFFPATAARQPAERARQVRLACRLARAAGLEAAGIAADSAGLVALANTAGLFAWHRQTRADFSVTATGADGASGWAEESAPDAKRLDAERVAAEAVRIARAARKPRRLPAGRYTVVLPPEAATEFLFFLAFHGLSGLAHLEGRTFARGKLGQAVMGPEVTIDDDSFRPETPGRPFDFEGTPKRPVTFVERGRLVAVAHDRATARTAGGRARSTGHALPQPNAWGPLPEHLGLAPGTESLDKLVRSTKRGLLVTHFHYTNLLDPMDLSLTGMTRDGLFLVERGEVVAPARNFRFTDSVLRVFKNLSGITRERKYAPGFFGGAFLVPGLRVEGFNFSSPTEF
jgi:predicted Zn-dependent protease